MYSSSSAVKDNELSSWASSFGVHQFHVDRQVAGSSAA
jgi:hypothetical protein